MSDIVDIDIAEVEIFIHGGGAQVVEDFAQAEVVVDVEGDTPEEVDANATQAANGKGRIDYKSKNDFRFFGEKSTK